MPVRGIPPLRPQGRHKAYYDELKAFAADERGQALKAEAETIKASEGFRLRTLLPLALRYRLKFAALIALLEDWHLLACGTYDRMQHSKVLAPDGVTYRRFAPMLLFAEYIEAHGLPDAAPGCEVVISGAQALANLRRALEEED